MYIKKISSLRLKNTYYLILKKIKKNGGAVIFFSKHLPVSGGCVAHFCSVSNKKKNLINKLERKQSTGTRNNRNVYSFSLLMIITTIYILNKNYVFNCTINRLPHQLLLLSLNAFLLKIILP